MILSNYFVFNVKTSYYVNFKLNCRPYTSAFVWVQLCIETLRLRVKTKIPN